MKYFNPLLFVAVLFFSLNAFSHDSVQNYNQVSLEASASAEVDNDTMFVSLYAQEEGSKATVLSNKVNATINLALQKLEQHKSIKVETESYSTNPVYNKNKIVSWRVRQSIKLESTDMSLMSEVLGDLQQHLKLSGISFDVSTAKRELKTKDLIDQALAAYNDRASQIAHKLKRANYKIVTMHVSTSASPMQHRYRNSTMMMAEASSKVVPQMAAGDRTLSVRVNGTIELE